MLVMATATSFTSTRMSSRTSATSCATSSTLWSARPACSRPEPRQVRNASSPRSSRLAPTRILRGALDGVTGPYDKLEPGDRPAVLSLRTTKQLIELMDGELRVEQGGVEAGPDAGTTFGFTILAEALPGAVATTLLTLEGMRVLVIAADPTEKRVLALQVEQWGANATSATPEDALGAIQMGRPFDIALIEHRATAIDGLQISSALRALRRPDQMPSVR